MIFEKEQLMPFWDKAIVNVYSKAELYESMSQAANNLVYIESNISTDDEPPTWLIQPYAAIMAKLSLPHIDIQQQVFSERVQRDYDNAVKTLRINRVAHINKNNTSAQFYGRSEEITW